MRSRSTLLVLIAVAVVLGACTGRKYDVAAWQTYTAPHSVPEMEKANSVEAAIQQIDAARASLDLDTARDRVLAAVMRWSDSGELQWRAARAESDAVFLFHPHESDQRALAALSAVEYARRATELAPQSSAAWGEYAWALGTTTHLQPMMERSAQARAIRDAIDRALSLDPSNDRAIATDAILQLRLETLPGIAKLMARGRPDSSLEQAESSARAAVDLLPSIEYRVLLAKVLAAEEKTEEAVQVLNQALAAPDRHPRDPQHRDAARDLLRTLTPEESS
jgi:tetratricopeptide (TPR) repeat protein